MNQQKDGSDESCLVFLCRSFGEGTAFPQDVLGQDPHNDSVVFWATLLRKTYDLDIHAPRTTPLRQRYSWMAEVSLMPSATGKKRAVWRARQRVHAVASKLPGSPRLFVLIQLWGGCGRIKQTVRLIITLQTINWITLHTASLPEPSSAGGCMMPWQMFCFLKA